MCSPEGPLEGFLSRNVELIVDRFVAEIRREAVAPSGTSRAQLVDHLPAFIREIGTTLALEASRPSVVDHASATAREHGQNRWALGYDVEGLVHEYGVLGRSILDLVEEQGLAIQVRELKVLVKRLDVGVSEAVAEYVKHRDSEINAQRERVERAMRAKDEFVAIISHELRTPLNSAMGWLSLLQIGKLPAERLSYALSVIERNCKAQARIVEDLLDISKLITGEVRIQPAQLDLSSVVQMVIESARPAVEAKQITLESDFDGSSAVLRGDSQRLQQVVWNLVSNAVKFTPKGGRIRVSLQRKRSALELRVEDDGEGIAPELLPHLFEPFNQLDSTSSRRHAGLGLGLAIVRHLVELHGGSIEASSSGPGQGALFTVRLPISLAVSSSLGISHLPPEAEKREEAGLPVALLGRKILIVDDDPDARELIATILETAGAQVCAAPSAKTALDALSGGFLPDVIVTDIGMPEDDGFSLLRGVLAQEGREHAPVLALSGRASDDDRKRAAVEGFDAYLTKPVEPSALVLKLAELAGFATNPVS